jgi:hypothetical protein
MKPHLNALLILFVLAFGGLVGFFSVKLSEQPLMLVAMLGFSIAFSAVFLRYELALRIAVLCLPFTQVPTFKFFMRWRISELVSWLYLPLHLVALPRLIKRMPTPILWVLSTMIGYFAYTGLIGLVHAPFVEIRVEKALEFTLSPFLRVVLETARGFASVSFFIGLLIAVRNWEGFLQIAKIFVWSGALSSGYGVYQAAVLAFGLPLPLLPGTLSHEGYDRPFGTFYEPTGMGSFTSATILLSLYFLLTEYKLLWLICLALNGLGFFVSLSRAGWIGLIVGVSALVCALWGHKRNSFLPILLVIILAGTLWLGYLGAVNLFGKHQVQFSLSRYWLEYSMYSRIEGYSELPSLLKKFPYGFGQGLFLFYGAGVPGFARLLVEGGFIGAFFLALLHINSMRCLLNLWSISSEQRRRMLPFIFASYVSSIVTTMNYINTTDMWIWFVWSLPVVALWAGAKDDAQNKSLASHQHPLCRRG